MRLVLGCRSWGLFLLLPYAPLCPPPCQDNGIHSLLGLVLATALDTPIGLGDCVTGHGLAERLPCRSRLAHTRALHATSIQDRLIAADYFRLEMVGK